MKKFLITLLIFLAAIISGFVYLVKPYETFEERRLGSHQIKVIANYVNVTGDPNCTKLYVTSPEPSDEPGKAIFPAVPEAIPSPDDGEYAYHGNRFELTGFPYEWVYRNIITGAERRVNSQRFDVVKWKIIVPYTVWSDKQSGDGGPLNEIRSMPLVYEYTDDDYSPNKFRMDNYINCLAGQ